MRGPRRLDRLLDGLRPELLVRAEHDAASVSGVDQSFQVSVHLGPRLEEGNSRQLHIDLRIAVQESYRVMRESTLPPLPCLRDSDRTPLLGGNPSARPLAPLGRAAQPPSP